MSKITFKKIIISVLTIITLVLLLIFLETTKTACSIENEPLQVSTVIDADPNSEEEKLAAEAIKLSITPMNMNSNEYITDEIK